MKSVSPPKEIPVPTYKKKQLSLKGDSETSASVPVSVAALPAKTASLTTNAKESVSCI